VDEQPLGPGCPHTASDRPLYVSRLPLGRLYHHILFFFDKALATLPRHPPSSSPFPDDYDRGCTWLGMDFLRKLRKNSVDLPSTPTAPKIGRIPLPEITSPVAAGSPLPLEDGEVIMVDRRPSPASPLSPMPRRRTGSVVSRSTTPIYLARSVTPAHPTPSPPLHAPTPKWQSQRTLLDHDWASCSPTPDPHVLKERSRALSTHSPVPRASSSRHQYERNTESPEDLKKKLHSSTPQPQHRSSSRYSKRTETPDVDAAKRPKKGILKTGMSH
jgi:hypothetical protein